MEVIVRPLIPTIRDYNIDLKEFVEICLKIIEGDIFKIPRKELASISKKRPLPWLRFMIINEIVIFFRNQISHEKIAPFLNKDRSTISSGIKKHLEIIDTGDSSYIQIYQDFLNCLSDYFKDKNIIYVEKESYSLNEFIKLVKKETNGANSSKTLSRLVETFLEYGKISDKDTRIAIEKFTK